MGVADDRPWMHKVFTKAELNEILTAADRILWDDDNGLMINLTLSNNQCMDFIHHWHITRDDIEVLDAFESISYIEDFLFHFVNFLENHLDIEQPNWRERYYGVEEEED